MQYTDVKSSNISAIGYDPETLTLRVRFSNGAEWEYAEISEQKHQQFLEVKSIGRFFATAIKPKHEGHRLDKIHDGTFKINENMGPPLCKHCDLQHPIDVQCPKHVCVCATCMAGKCSSCVRGVPMPMRTGRIQMHEHDEL